ncbi:HNH endonuclease [Streptomyces sp. NPDC102384]|uniref:HNH endonuclease n=1 Tax=Streptomyces sp. NPDC102384 TaxID=3366166 RepID=UPI00381FF3C8
MAREKSQACGVDASDLYAAAVCWWSTAIAPAAVLPSWPEAPLSVWSSFVSKGTQLPPLHAALDIDRVAPLATRQHVTSRREFSSALFSAHRDYRTGRGADAVLLTGSPFPPSGQRASTITPLLEGPIRQAWDGRHYFISRQWHHKRPAAPPPRVGVMWELSSDEWQRFNALHAATFSRSLHFTRRPPTPPSQERRPNSPALQWLHALTTAYGWVFQHRPILEFSPAAIDKLTAFVDAGGAKRSTLPRLAYDFLVRDRDHLCRISGALAASEMSRVQGIHVDAAWSLVRRAMLDTLTLLHTPSSTIRNLTAGLDTAISSVADTAPAETPRQIKSWGQKPTLTSTTNKTRGASVVNRIKNWYKACQMCGEAIHLPHQDRAYTEAAHIQPLNGDTPGPDIIENLLCLCANCHVRFDYGALVISDSLVVIDTATGKELGKLGMHPWHNIDPKFLRHHREQWTDSTKRAPTAQQEQPRDN